MIQLFRKTRSRLLKEGKFRKYILYAVGEVLLIVIGVMLALRLDTLKQNSQNRSYEKVIYQTIRDQLVNYKTILENDMDFNNNFTKQFQYASEIVREDDRTRMDTLGEIARKLFNYSDFDGRGNLYESLVNSGEIKLLGNLEIVEGIRVLEERLLYVNRMENIHYDAMMLHVIPSVNDKIEFATGEIKDPENIYSFKFRNLIFLLLRVMDEKDRVYQGAISNIDGVVEMIDDELGKK